MYENDDLLAKYNSICDKVSADIKEEFDSKPAYNNFFLEIKKKSHGNGNEVTGFYDI